MNKFLRLLKLRYKMIKSSFTNVIPDYETLVALHGRQFADNVIGQIENNFRQLRSQGTTRLYCPECNDSGVEIPDVDSPEYISKREKEINSLLINKR